MNIFASRSIMTLSTALLTACGKWESLSSDPSPDGSSTAIVEYRGGAACCSDHSRLRLENARRGTLSDPGIAVEVTRARVQANWINDDLLLVEACSATGISVRSRMQREPVINRDGSINALRIEVITVPTTFADGTSYCTTETED